METTKENVYVQLRTEKNLRLEFGVDKKSLS